MDAERSGETVNRQIQARNTLLTNRSGSGKVLDMATNNFERIEAGSYRCGEYTIRDTYSPSGPAHVRYPTLTCDRWLVQRGFEFSQRFDTLKRAKLYVETVTK